MRSLASIVLLAGASTTEAFAPPTTSTRATTALNHIDTRKRGIDQELGIWEQTCRDDRGNYVPCQAISGHERRAMWESYAPVHGSPTYYGAIGCPGGGDWCYASSYGAAMAIPDNYDNKKRAATVAAALAGLGSGVGGAASVARHIGSGANGGGQSSRPALSSSSSGSVSGEDVREARTSYAPYTTHEGRVGTLGEIGAGSGASGSMPIQNRGSGLRKSYAIGSWKK